MRAVTSAAAAAILGIERKAFDNLIARIGPGEFPKGRQGIDRRIPVASLAALRLAHEFSLELAIPIGPAFQLARSLEAGEPASGVHFELRADFPALRKAIDRDLAQVVETLVRRRRGRPPRARR